MTIEDELIMLEETAVTKLENVAAMQGTIHDYRNILMHVDRAMRAVNNAYITISRARDRLQDIANNQ